ncbi:MAG TPA: YHS domain-containing (seleno)protein [Sediminibacterium sp.]|jgi:YHS domain-containing protein|nr:YHS domain-containing (seleno)protein [Sediminibacterium sp.]
MKQVLVILLFLTTSLIANSQKSEIYIKDGKAIQGYDVVAFHLEQKPILGNSSFIFNWKGADWYFLTESNLKLFKLNPEKYAPQFGGYCAYGASDGDGHKAPTKIETWTLLNEKLYFNYNLKVKELWNKNQTIFIEKAEINWPKIKDKE